jgi:hypothetical protein
MQPLDVLAEKRELAGHILLFLNVWQIIKFRNCVFSLSAVNKETDTI